MDYADAAAAILLEALDAHAKFPPFNSAHEGWAVLYEEVDEIWDEVRADNLDAAIAEAIQAGAMCVRFVADMRAKAAQRDCPHDSLSGAEGPVSELGRMPERWRCDECGAEVAETGRGGGDDQSQGTTPPSGATICDQPPPTQKPPKARSHAQDAVQHTCVICGRTGSRRFTRMTSDEGDDLWRCAPTATACPGNRRTFPPPPKSSSQSRAQPDTPQVDASEPCPKPEPAQDNPPPPTIPPGEPVSREAGGGVVTGVTARCQDCSRTWTHTSPVLDMLIEKHELTHGHIVTVVVTDA